ncbi:MAG TPA: hypothetical protein VFA10_11515 [Ktedonobacteraceae bacterium]|nr:hypothetical protein [Ktedonobacteraceae bacterium]
MTVQEIADLLQLHGWYLDLIRRYKTRYAYAKRRVGNQVQTRYLKTEAKLEEVTPAFVLERITRSTNARQVNDVSRTSPAS